MKKTTSVILIIVGVAVFFLLPLFQKVDAELIESCQQRVTDSYEGTDSFDEFMQKCEKEENFAALMSADNALDASRGAASANIAELILTIIRYAFLGMAIGLFLKFFIKK